MSLLCKCAGRLLFASKSFGIVTHTVTVGNAHVYFRKKVMKSFDLSCEDAQDKGDCESTWGNGLASYPLMLSLQSPRFTC